MPRYVRAFIVFPAAFFLASCVSSFCATQETQANAGNEIEEFDFANGLFSRSMYDLAVDSYRDFIKDHPGSKFTELAKFRIGESYFLARKYKEALDQFEAFLREYPSDDLAFKAKLRAGHIYALLGDNAKAQAVLSPLATGGTDETANGAKYYLAAMYLKKGEYTTSEKLLDSILSSPKAGPYTVFAYMNLGDILSGRKDHLKAGAAYKSANELATEATTRAQAAYRAGGAYYLAGDYSTAAGLYKQITDAQETSEIFDPAAVGLMSSLSGAKNYDGAMEASNILLTRARSDETKAQIMCIAGNCLFNKENYAEAKTVYADAYAKYPAAKYGLKAGLNVGWALYKLGDLAGSLSWVEAFMAKTKELGDEAMYLKAKLLADMGRKEEAMALYKAVTETYKDSGFSKESLYDTAWLMSGSGQPGAAISHFELFAEKYPDDSRSPAALLKAGQDNLEQKRFKEAEADYTKFLARYSKDPLKEKVAYQLGRAYLEEGDNDKAIETYTAFLREFPASKGKESAVFSIGQAHRKKQEWDKAMEKFSSLVTDPRSGIYGKSMESLAYCFFETGDYEKTAATYFDLIQRKPDYKLPDGIYRWVADYYLKKSQPKESIAALKARAEKYPEAASSGEISYLYGENYKMIGDAAKAAESYAKAINENAPAPYLERAHLGLGMVYASQNQNEKAIEEYGKALEGEKDNMTGALARIEIGNVKFKSGDTAGAAKEYMMVAILYDDEDVCSRALFRAAEAFEKSGAPGKAVDTLNELIKRYPENALAKKALEEIGRLKSAK